jgi:hypothetical protein
MRFVIDESGKITKSVKVLTVTDFINALQKLPLDAPLIYASDDEGNQFNLVRYLPSVTYIESLTDIKIKAEGAKKVVVIN